MKTVVFIVRHSESFKNFIDNYNTNEIEQIKNEKLCLSVNGEEKAKKLSKYDELNDVDVIYSSHYVRAMSTAKYIASFNNLKLNIDSRFGERKFGVSNIKKLPKNFEFRQLENWNYRLFFGESLNQVKRRITKAFIEVLNNNSGKKVVIISHATAMLALFENWCRIKVNYSTELAEIYYKNKLIFDGNWSAPELFRLEFDGNKLISITNVKKGCE